MPRGDKSSYTTKQKRKARHIESKGSGRGKPKVSAGKGGRLGGSALRVRPQGRGDAAQAQGLLTFGWG